MRDTFTGDARAAIAAALHAAEPRRLVREALDAGHEAAASLAVLAVGKAAHGMLDGALDWCAAHGVDATHALVVAPAMAPEWPGVLQFRGAHPLPDEQSARAGAGVAAWLDALPDAVPLLVLLSGGASALMVQPLPGVSLADLVATHAALHAAGLGIDEINTVRKHLDAVKGGRLAALAGARRVDVLVISDVIGNRLDVIGSGPFHADPTTWADALAVVRRAGGVPAAVVALHEAGARGEWPDTPKPGDPCFGGVQHHILADNATARRAAAAELRARGYDVHEDAAPLRGVAAAHGRELAERAGTLRGRAAYVAGGEPIVAVRGSGRGGRCQELALAAALALDGVPGVSIVAFATDGVDGPTDAAGAIVDGTTAARMRAAGLDPDAALAQHDSHRALDAAGALIRTGPTGTNVNDVVLLLSQ